MKKNAWRYNHFTHVHQRWWLDEAWFLRYGTWQTDWWTDGQKKWHTEVDAPPKKINISNRVQLSLGWKKRKQENCKSNSLIQTLVYRSNIYYSKIYQRGNWKNNSSTLHLEVWTRYFRHRYSIKLCRTWMNLKIIKPNQCSLERSHAVLIKLKDNSKPRLMLIYTKTNP